MKCVQHTTMTPHTTAHNKTTINNSRDTFQETFIRKNALTRCKSVSKHASMSQLNCAHTHHTKTTPQNSPNSTTINHSHDTIKRYLFAKWNLRAARIVTEHASSRQKWSAHITRRWNHKSSPNSTIINNLRDTFKKQPKNAAYVLHKLWANMREVHKRELRK